MAWPADAATLLSVRAEVLCEFDKGKGNLPLVRFFGQPEGKSAGSIFLALRSRPHRRKSLSAVALQTGTSKLAALESLDRPRWYDSSMPPCNPCSHGEVRKFFVDLFLRHR